MSSPSLSPPPSRTPASRRRRLSNFHLPPTPAQPPRPSTLKRVSVHPSVVTTPLPPSSSTAKNRQSIHSRLSTTASRRRRRTSRMSHAPLSREQITQIYSSTIKLCQDNKINARNTWNLNLIDYMPMLVRAPESGPNPSPTPNASDTDFQLAGVTIDAGVRIYCSRVDSVHTNAFKVLGDLSHSTGNKNASSDAPNDPNLDDDADDSNGRRGNRSARRAGRATLETKMQNITSNTLESDMSADPFFKKMSAAFDDGGASGMLLYNLPVDPCGHIMFDSADPCHILQPLAVTSSKQDDVYSSASLHLPEPGDQSVSLCPNFLRFFRARTGEQASVPQFVDAIESQVSSWPDEEETSHTQEAIDFDYCADDLDSTVPIGVFVGPANASEHMSDHFDTSAMQDEDGNNSDDVDMFRNASSNHTGAGAALSDVTQGGMDLVEAGVTLRENDEYEFFSRNALSGWAGPQHWKFRATGLGTSTTTRAGSKSRKPRGRIGKLLDFSEKMEEDFGKEFVKAKTKQSLQLSGKAWSGSDKMITLPVDLQVSKAMFRSLFLKPGFRIGVRASSGARMVEDGEGGGEDWETEGRWKDFDEMHEDTEIGGVDDGFNEMGEGAGDMEEMRGGVEEDGETEREFGTGLDLVEEPTRVQATDIGYAKVAKKVDVRELKKGMWKLLCGESWNERGQVVGDSGDGTRTEEVEKEVEKIGNVRKGRVQGLQEVVKEMREKMPSELMEDVSLSYVFIGLLHLANEKGLTMRQRETEDGALGLDDVEILMGTNGTEE